MKLPNLNEEWRPSEPYETEFDFSMVGIDIKHDPEFAPPPEELEEESLNWEVIFRELYD